MPDRYDPRLRRAIARRNLDQAAALCRLSISQLEGIHSPEAAADVAFVTAALRACEKAQRAVRGIIG